MLGRRLGPIVGHFDALPLVGRLGRRLASEARPGKSAGRATSAGRAYLARNAEREGVRATSTGLQYRVLRSGAADAEQPTAASSCECHYRGRLLDGVEFDSMSKQVAQTSASWLSGGSFSARSCLRLPGAPASADPPVRPHSCWPATSGLLSTSLSCIPGLAGRFGSHPTPPPWARGCVGARGRMRVAFREESC